MVHVRQIGVGDWRPWRPNAKPNSTTRDDAEIMSAFNEALMDAGTQAGFGRVQEELASLSPVYRRGN